MLAAVKLRFFVVFFFLHVPCHASHSTGEVEPPKDDCTESEAATDRNCFEIQPTDDGSGSASEPNNSLGSGTDYDMVLQSKRGKIKQKCRKKNVKSKCKKSQRKGKRRPNARNFSRKKQRRAEKRKKNLRRRKDGKQQKRPGRKKQRFQNMFIDTKIQVLLQYGLTYMKTT